MVRRRVKHETAECVRRSEHARRSEAARRGWERRRAAAEHARRSEAAKRGWKRRRAAKVTRLDAEGIASRIESAAGAALRGDSETALNEAAALLAWPRVAGDVFFAVRALYLRSDGVEVWVTLTPLTPLTGLAVALLALAERGETVQVVGYWRDEKGLSLPAELVRVVAYVVVKGEG